MPNERKKKKSNNKPTGILYYFDCNYTGIDQKPKSVGLDLISVKPMSKPDPRVSFTYDVETAQNVTRYGKTIIDKIEKDGAVEWSKIIDEEIIKEMMKKKDDTLNKHFDYVISKTKGLEADEIVSYLVELANKLNQNPETFCSKFTEYWQDKMNKK
jgi:hypothetical protein